MQVQHMRTSPKEYGMEKPYETHNSMARIKKAGTVKLTKFIMKKVFRLCIRV